MSMYLSSKMVRVVYKKLEAVAPTVVCVGRTTHDSNKLTNK
jgi:hypothetical protein